MTKTPQNIKLDCQNFRIAALYENAGTIIHYLESGEMPENPNRTFLALFDEVKAQREGYLRMQERMQERSRKNAQR